MRKHFPSNFYYQKQLKFTKDSIKKVEQEIGDLQESYLRKTKFCGNILHGFRDYILQKTLMIHTEQVKQIEPYERIFSLSSVTSQASLQYGNVQPKSGKFIKKRVTRSTIKRKPVQDQRKQQKQQGSLSECSLLSRYQREGSLHRRPKPFQDMRSVRTEDNLSRTLTQHQKSVNAETESLVSEVSEMKNKCKKTQLNRNVKRWMTNRKRKIERLALQQIEKGQDVIKIQSSSDEQEGEYIFRGAGSIQNKSSQLPILLESEEDRNYSDKDSCDSVDLFIRMARSNK